MEVEKEKKIVPKLRFSEFKGLLRERKLGDITTKIGSGSTPKGGEKIYQTEGVPFIRSQNVVNNKLIHNDDVYISDSINSRMKGSIVKPNDVLLNITGGSIGRSCVVPSFFDIGNVNQHVCIIRLKNDFNPRFIQPFLASHKGQKLIYQGMTGSGREGLNFQSISLFKFSIPTLPEQQKIASFLSAVDKKIEQLSQKKTLLETYKKGVMQKIFLQKLRFKKDDDTSYPDWEEKLIGDIAKVRGGKRIPKGYSLENMNNGFPYITVSDMDKNSVSLSNIKYVPLEVIDKIKNYKISKNDIFISVAGTLGNVGIVPKELDGANLTENANKLTDLKCNQSFLLHLFSTKLLTNQIKSVTTIGAQPKLAIYALNNFKFVIPNSMVEQQKIASFLSVIDKKIELVNTQLKQTKTFKKGLLQQMFV